MGSEFAPQVGNGGRKRIGCDKEVYLFIWYVSNTLTFRQIGNLFGISKSSAWYAIQRVSKWLVSIGHEFITWPDENSAKQNWRKFELKRKIPGVIGAIDCSHINIKAPNLHKESYFDRKQNYSLVLQLVVDADKKIMDIHCGEPGSLHDSRVLRRSELYKNAFNDPARMFPHNSFLLGDSAYASSAWIVPPFKDNGTLNDTQKAFNYLHSATRIVVENTFASLKNRFRRLLHFCEQSNLCMITNIIVSICILYNICTTMDDHYGVIDEDTSNTDFEEEAYVVYSQQANGNRREALYNNLQSNHII